MLSSKTKGYMDAVFATMFMGSLGIFVKYMSVAPSVMTFFRLFLSALFMLIFMIVRRRAHLLKAKPTKKIVFSSLALTSSVIFYIIAIQKTSMSNAVFLLYLGPVFASLAAFVFLKESLKGLDILSLFFSMLGILFMLKFNFSLEGSDMVGMVCGILSGLSYGMIIFSNRMIEKHIDLDARSFYQFILGSMVILPFALKGYNFYAIKHDFVLLVSMAFICGFLGITLMFDAIKRLPAVEYGVLSYLEMFFAATFGIVVFGDNVDLFKVTGGVLILSSGVLQVFKNRIRRMFV